MEDQKKYGIGIIGLVIIISLWVHVNTLNKKIDEREEMIHSCGSQIDEANDAIDEANSQIEDAQGNAWSDYDSMGDALDNLTEVDSISNDCYVPSDN